MSETVHYRGTLTEVEKLENEILEKQCMRLLNNVELPSCYDSYQEMLEDEYYNHYVVHDDILYSINKKSIDLDQDIFNSHKNEDGSINFEVRYYNGGCGFDEAIEEALNNMELNK